MNYGILVKATGETIDVEFEKEFDSVVSLIGNSTPKLNQFNDISVFSSGSEDDSINGIASFVFRMISGSEAELFGNVLFTGSIDALNLQKMKESTIALIKTLSNA